MADFKALITLPGWLSRPARVLPAAHQNSLFARALGAVFNALLPKVNAIRRLWIVSQTSGAVLKEHGADRAVHKRAGELDVDYMPRVLAGLRAKTPGETKAGMRIALDTLGLAAYQILELYTLAVEDPADPRWDEFEVRYADVGNEGLTDAEVQTRIDAAKPPRAKGIAVRYRGATIQGFGDRFGRNFGN